MAKRPDGRYHARELFFRAEPLGYRHRLCLRGAGAYQLSWFDAHMWAYAEHHGIETLLSEDFQHGRLYGSVQAVNPFLTIGA